MKMRPIEVYYGFTQGNLKVWDTFYVSIPADTPDDQIADSTLKAVADNFAEYPPGVDVSFTGVYNIPQEWDNEEELGHFDILC